MSDGKKSGLTISIGDLSKLKAWQGLMLIGILLAAGWATSQGLQITGSIGLGDRITILEKTLQTPVNSSFYALQKDCSFTIGKVGAYATLQNGLNGALLFYSTNASRVIANALGNVTLLSRGSIFVKANNYTLTTPIKITTSHIGLICEQGTVFTSTTMPILNITGGALDVNAINDLTLENIYFEYTGPEATGEFIHIQGIQSDYKYQGGIRFINLNIYSTQVAPPPNLNFVGMHIDQFVGVDMIDCNIKYFGTALKLGSTLNQADLFNGINLQVSFAQIGINCTASFSRMTLTNFKAMNTNQFAIWGYGAPNNLNLISPQIDTFLGVGIYTTENLVVTDGRIANYPTTGGAAAIQFNKAGATISKTLNVQNTFFANGQIAIETYANTILRGNTYSNLITNILPVGTLAQIDNENDGSMTYINGAVFPVSAPEWTYVTNGSSFMGVFPTCQYGNTLGTVSSYASAWSYLYNVAPQGSSVTTSINYTRVFKWSFQVTLIDTITLNTTAHFQIKNDYTVFGNLTSTGFGINVFGNNIYADAYGVAGNHSLLIGTLTAFVPKVFQIILIPGDSVQFWVNGALMATLSGTAVPVGEMRYIYAGITNGGTSGGNVGYNLAPMLMSWGI